MAVTYSDADIAKLLQEQKPLPAEWRSRLTLRPKRGHDERNLDFTNVHKNEFRLILRQNKINVLDFSVILAVRVPKSHQFFRLRRYNGKSHEHTNHIEDRKFYDFHIHSDTERYQQLGTWEDAYAEPTARYADFHGALRCLFNDANFVASPDTQSSLFE